MCGAGLSRVVSSHGWQVCIVCDTEILCLVAVASDTGKSNSHSKSCRGKKKGKTMSHHGNVSIFVERKNRKRDCNKLRTQWTGPCSYITYTSSTKGKNRALKRSEQRCDCCDVQMRRRAIGTQQMRQMRRRAIGTRQMRQMRQTRTCSNAKGRMRGRRITVLHS